MADGYTEEELEDALNAADAGNWEPLEAFTQQKHVLAPDRVNTCVYERAIISRNERIEYHRGLGTTVSWWREMLLLFADEVT